MSIRHQNNLVGKDADVINTCENVLILKDMISVGKSKDKTTHNGIIVGCNDSSNNGSTKFMNSGVQMLFSSIPKNVHDKRWKPTNSKKTSSYLYICTVMYIKIYIYIHHL